MFELRRKFFLQHDARAMQTDLYGGDGNVEGLGALVDAEFFDVAKGEDFAIDEREVFNGGAQEGSNFGALECFGGNLAPVAQDRRAYAGLVVARIFNRVCGVLISAAQNGTGLIECDADEPCAEAGFCAEAGEVAIGLEDGFLRRFFGVGFVFSMARAIA